MSKTVVMFCYFFPPLSGGGVQRSLQFAKYLPECGWDPVVVSVAPNRRNAIEVGRDYASLSEIDASTRVYRARSRELADLYSLFYRFGLRKVIYEAERFVPNMHQDYKQGWVRPALRLARSVMASRTERTVVYTSTPPYATHRIGLRLQQSRGLPWVADNRDPLTLMANYRPGTPIQRWIDTRLDRAVAKSADALIANTETDRSRFVERFDVPGERIHVIPNGFDPDDFGLTDHAPQHSRTGGSGFRVTCVGKFYEMPDTSAFFRAFRSFSVTHPEVSLRFLAPLTRGMRRAAEEELSGTDWSIRDRLPHGEAVAEMRRSDVLLTNLSEGLIHQVPGKLYEYLAARRPVLFIGPDESDAAQLVRRAGAGEVAGFDEASISRALESLYAQYRHAPDGFTPRESVIDEFNRREQVKKLATILDAISDARPR